MNISFSDRYITDILNIYGYKPNRLGFWRLCDICDGISVAFPRYRFICYRSYPSTLGGRFGRWIFSRGGFACGGSPCYRSKLSSHNRRESRVFDEPCRFFSIEDT